MIWRFDYVIWIRFLLCFFLEILLFLLLMVLIFKLLLGINFLCLFLWNRGNNWKRFNENIYKEFCIEFSMVFVRKFYFWYVFGSVVKKDKCFDGFICLKNFVEFVYCVVNFKFFVIIIVFVGGGVFFVLWYDEVSCFLFISVLKLVREVLIV